jgi:hypothetical protein
MTIKSWSVVATMVAAALAMPVPVVAQNGTKVGTLTCRLSPSIGLIIGSHQRMACHFAPNGSSAVEAYSGVMNRIGLDIGITAGGVLAWGVYMSTKTPPLRGGIAGRYAGASGEIGVGLGVGANVLLGGSNNAVSLQPISLEGSIGLNLALGVAGLTLTWVP